MSDYERGKLQQFVDIMTADGIPKMDLLSEVADIIGRKLLFQRDRRLIVASKELVDAVKRYGLELPGPPYMAYPITQAILSAEIEKSRKRIKQ